MSATPNRRLGFSHPGVSLPSPFLTPRTDKRPSDLRWAEGCSTMSRQDKEGDVNVQVVIRCRPLSDEDNKLNVQKVISCNEHRKEVSVLQNTLQKQAEKTFYFDKVFGPNAQQKTIYDHAISPLVKDALEGFNCTVFVYGQTGTGKTYTMEGGTKSEVGELSGDSGIIPRVFYHIFDELESQNTDYSIKVTFLELYNEEINDLLACDDNGRFLDDKQRRTISVMEDGKGGAVIRGLQEEVVYSPYDACRILERGSTKRKTGDTLLNNQSSRSHSIFSITINVKEAAIGGSELVKCGRLNLVDLAGSESISKSGAREGREREAGETNRSLLTLGRVITALVEHSVHIPYRDSKLTRLLRESLGGKEKTCIIATISPSIHCVEESLRTLDYANRAKSIRNKPETNRRFSKSVVLKDLHMEIKRLKHDVRAAREKNGIYIPQERLDQDGADKKCMYEKIEQLEFELKLSRKETHRFQVLYHSSQEHVAVLDNEIKEYKTISESCRKALKDLQEAQKVTELKLKEKEIIISKLLQSENALLQSAKELHGNLESASENISQLWDKIESQKKTEAGNHGLILKFGSELGQNLNNLQKVVIGSVSRYREVLRYMEEYQSSFLAAKCEAAKCLETRIDKIKATYNTGIQNMKDLSDMLSKNSSFDFEHLKSTISSNYMAVENFLVTAVSEAQQVLDDAERCLSDQKELVNFSAQQHEERLQQSLVLTQAISRTTIDFFNDLHRRASKLISVHEEKEMEKLYQIGNFELKYKVSSNTS